MYDHAAQSSQAYDTGASAERLGHICGRDTSSTGAGSPPAAREGARGRRIAAEELLTIAAHDIRNYLTPMRGRIALLRQRAIREHRQIDIRDFAALEQSIERLSLLAANVLDVARLDAGLFTVYPRQVDLVELARETAGTMENGTVKVRVQSPVANLTIKADPERVRQALENLVGNAVRYSPDDGTVLIRIARNTADKKDWVTLTIEDQGPGVPAELLPHLFAPLHVGPGSVGLGLGLYLARKIAVAHGGSLAIQSPPGGGARFVLTFPDHPVVPIAPDGVAADSVQGSTCGSRSDIPHIPHKEGRVTI